MNKPAFIWRIPGRALPIGAPMFSSEWVCRADDMHIAPESVCGMSIWMVMSDSKKSFLFGHLTPEKIECDKKGDYILTADPRVSFRILPRKKSDWHEWQIPSNGTGLRAMDNITVGTIRNATANNIKMPPIFSKRDSHKPIFTVAQADDTESAYLRALCEKCYGDLEWPRDRQTTPYATLLTWKDEKQHTPAAERLKVMDRQLMHILKNGSVLPQKSRSMVVVDTVLRPADKTILQERTFIKQETSSFSMDKTNEAEKSHQKIVGELLNFFTDHNIGAMYSRSIDLAIRSPNLWIFEVKSANKENFEKQARHGIIQILEYKMWMEKMEPAKVSPFLVIASIHSESREDYVRKFAETTGITVIFYTPSISGKFPLLDKMLGRRRRR